jgi:hypothetical protein
VAFQTAIDVVASGAGNDGVIDVAGLSGGPGLVSGPLHRFKLWPPAVTTSIGQS